MTLNFERYLNTATATSRCLLAVALSTPFFLVFWAAGLSALTVPEVARGVNRDVVVLALALLTAGISFNLGMSVWLWPKRLLAERLPRANLMVALTIGLLFLAVMIALGAFTTGGNLVMFGVLTVGLLLFDQRTMLICFVVCIAAHMLVDGFILTGKISYAPVLSEGAFANGEPTWWWSLARGTVLYAAWLALLPLIFGLFSRLDALHSQLSKLSYTDVLTGLANRRYFMERLRGEALRQKRTRLPFSLVLLDADHFKLVNDQYGHMVGDCVLRHIADTLVEGIRTPTDQPARMGGEEFAILLPDTDLAAATVVCQRIANRLRTHTFEDRGQRFHVTVSMGVVECSHDDIEAALKQADVNLYQAKNQGRDRVIGSCLAPAVPG